MKRSNDVVSARLGNHKLASSQFKKPAEVVHWFGAVQAQDYNAAKWALALRMRKGTMVRVEEAFDKGEILRTHVMRPTWHFITPEDIRWLLKLTAPRVNVKAGPNYRKFELDAAVFKQTHKVLTKALQGGKHLTRPALKSALNKAGIDANDTIRLAHILLRAELDGVVCSGPRIGKQFTYALLEERVPPGRMLERDEALAEIVRRYFRSHGPATLHDFVWWSGLTMEDASRGIAQVEHELEKFVIDEKIFRGPRPSATKSEYAAHLLPVFDEYFVAYKDRQIAFDGEASLTTWDLLGPTFIINGTVGGLWKRISGNDSMTIELNASRAITKSEKLAVLDAVNRYAEFLNVRVETHFGEISRRK